MPTGLGICNNALEQAKSQDLLTGGSGPTNFVGTPAIATAANTVYVHVRDFLLRQLNPEFARITSVAVPAGVPPIAPWAYEYLYPFPDGMRIRKVRPPTSGPGALADPNERLPVPAAVAFDPGIAAGVGGTGAKVVLTNQQNALLVYTSNLPDEAYWDQEFTEAMEKKLASIFAMAIAGRPDFARELLEQCERYSSLAMENGDL